jgi:hypothetical protein
MTKIQSTIGESNFQIPNQRNYTIDDETLSRGRVQPQPQLSQVQMINPAVAAGLRKQALDKQEQIEHKTLQDARRRVEIITGLGRLTKEVPIQTPSGPLTFTLRTLKKFEQNCLAQVVESVERTQQPDGRVSFNTSSMNKIEVEALSHSLFLIDGQSIDLVLGTENLDYAEQVLARKDLIDEMDGALIDHLFLQYEQLSKEAYDGYAPKTASEAKEVVETIRKSSTNA